MIHKILVVVAHYDDEALFFGGTLLRMAKSGNIELTIVVVTDVVHTNAPGHKEKTTAEQEMLRCNTRLSAFYKVCFILGANYHHLKLPNNTTAAHITHSLQPIIDDIKPGLIITHNEQGEYGHDQHVATHKAVMLCRGKIETWTLAELGGDSTVQVSVDRKEKITLLKNYKKGGHRVKNWRPWEGKNYGKWVTNHENYVIYYG